MTYLSPSERSLSNEERLAIILEEINSYANPNEIISAIREAQVLAVEDYKKEVREAIISLCRVRKFMDGDIKFSCETTMPEGKCCDVCLKIKELRL